MDTSDGAYALELEGVTKTFGDHVAVDALDLRIPSGSLYGFLGPNGAGKTTTIRMIMSIIFPDEGRLSVLGHPRAEEIKDRLGYLPEEKGLYKKMKTGELIAYFGRLKGLDKRAARARARQLLDEYGLGEWHDQRCETLSKGMGQKVQILSALVHEPELVILDEPFSGLDPVNVELMRDLILDLKREGRTVIFSTHVMEQAEQICEYIFLINKGKKVLDGPIGEIKAGAGRSVKLEYEGDGRVLPATPGIARVHDAGMQAEVFLEDEADPQEVLKALVDKIRIRRWDISEPSLFEIFIRAVEGEDL
ncbi:MAG TPA: ATP-binding cassette domain-containing protein [Planctomycetes bacterium]|nr:ATP-binding cassette domain-containing protein [Planctomycetota bacterium]